MLGPAVPVTPPAALPVAVEELRRFCRVKDDSEDDFLLSLAASATARLHGYGGRLGRALIHSTWRQPFSAVSCWPQIRMRLKLPDVASANLIFLDTNGVEGVPIQVGFDVRRDDIGWFIDPHRGQLWPSSRGIVEYVAGYGETPDAVPAPIREAICMMVQGTYRLTAADATLRNETVEGVGSQGFFGPEIMRNATTAHVDDLLKPYRWIPV